MKAKIWDIIITKKWLAIIVMNDKEEIKRSISPEIKEYWYWWCIFNKEDWLYQIIHTKDVIRFCPIERFYFID